MAVIRYKSMVAIIAELTTFFQDKDELEGRIDEGEEDTVILEEQQSIKAQQDQFCSWLGLTAERFIELGSSGRMDQILSTCKRSTEFFHALQPERCKEVTLSHPTATSFFSSWVA